MRPVPLARWGRPLLSLVGLAFVLAVGFVAASDGFAYDAHAYWTANDYTLADDASDYFLYSPPVLMAARVLNVIPWPVWLVLYTLAIAVGIWILSGPWTLLVVFTPWVASELTLANIHVFLALVAVFGIRWPGLWSFALLTKVTPGIGLLWFVARGEWRKLAIALGVTVAIVVPTLFIAPDLWSGWVAKMLHGHGSDFHVLGPLWMRLPLAAALIWVGAKRDWPWVLPLGAMIALPILWSVHGLSMLLGVLWWIRR